MGINNGKQKNIIRKNGIVLLLIFSIVFVQPLSVFATEDLNNGLALQEVDPEIDPETGEYILHDQSDYVENSFRYEDGEQSGSENSMRRSRARSESDEKAWQKIDGVCYNDYGC